MRRLVVCCDGTWESALFQTRPDMLTNVARLANAVEHRDERGARCEQVSLYLPGLGTGEETLEGALTGAFGDGLLDQVRQAYDFLSRNFRSGDEILLFGFSRGAYVCRLLLALVDLVGILDPKVNLHLFPALFNALCLPIVHETTRSRRNEARRAELLSQVAPFVGAQKAAQPGGCLIKVPGVFECVPLLHLPRLSSPASPSPLSLTPFSTLDTLLEPSVQHVYQALALNERRAPYQAIVFEQKPDSIRQGQELVQVWFSGCHGDVGGGYTLTTSPISRSTGSPRRLRHSSPSTSTTSRRSRRRPLRPGALQYSTRASISRRAMSAASPSRCSPPTSRPPLPPRPNTCTPRSCVSRALRSLDDCAGRSTM